MAYYYKMPVGEVVNEGQGSLTTSPIQNKKVYFSAPDALLLSSCRVWFGVHRISRRSVQATHLSALVRPLLLYASDRWSGLTVHKHR